MKAPKKWSDMSSWQRIAVAIGALIQVSLLAAALLDLRRRPPDGVRGPKIFWSMVAFVNYVGPISYFVIGRKRG